jgi:hypothetical protein
MNPDYGKGAARRRILLRAEPGRVEGSLTDNFHGMRCVLEHDGRTVTDIRAEILRIPTTSCPGAAGAVRELIGLPVDIATAELYSGGRPRRNCTHLFDLAGLALAQAVRGPGTRRYDVLVTDQTDRPVPVEVRLDGVVVHRWQVVGREIAEPEALAGKPMLLGFSRWAQQSFTGDALEAATVLSRTFFIAQGRRVLTEARAGDLVEGGPPMEGVCHGYASERIGQTRYFGGHRREWRDGIPDDLVDGQGPYTA